MHSQRRPTLAAHQPASVADEERQAQVNPESDAPIPGAQARLFFERRHSKPVETSWPEAMDTVHRHLTGLELTNRALQESESRYRALFEGAPVGMFQMSPDGKFLDLNEAMARILGFESAKQALEDAAEGKSPVFFSPSQWDEKGLFDRQGYLQTGIDLQVNCRNGVAKWVRFNIRAVRNDGCLVRFDGVSEDVTNRKRNEIKTEALAYYDLLTGLPNRTLFNQHLGEELTAAREQGRRVALFLVEVERFKVINDSLGDMFGDRLLQETAAWIKAGTGEDSIVARVGGAEFAIMVPKVGRLSQVEGAAKDLVAKLSTEHTFLGHSLSVSCNVGVSVFPDSGTDSEMLMKRSDLALCRAREDSTNRFAIFTEAMNGELMGRMTLESGLRQVLSRKELFLEYQPQVDMLTGEITGLEALLRWNHRQRGLIPPNDFIDIAESSGLIVPIGEWVLRSACTQAQV
jgi:diguanylate cyclase (GGDEF)-like protein/PAS domain S-box-containing protein